jgi:hypothetical protein
VAKQATLKRIALSGWQNKVDGVDTVDDVDEVDDLMVVDPTLDVMEGRATLRWPMPTWQKSKLKS